MSGGSVQLLRGSEETGAEIEQFMEHPQQVST